MASTISAGTTTTTALSYSADTSGVLQLQTNGTTTAVTIDTSQNVGLGVTPSAWGGNYKTIQNAAGFFGNYQTGSLIVGQNYYDSGVGAFKYVNNGYATYYIQGSGIHSWYNAPSGTAGNAITFTQAMTLDVSGNLLVRCTSSGFGNDNGTSIENGAMVQRHVNGTASGSPYTYFIYNGNNIGSIAQNGTTGVLYNTTSDYRLKSNVVPVTTGLSVINQLNPVNFTWISDNESDTGFLAHEFQTVIPRAVTGTKDATIEEEYEVTPAVKDEQGNITTPAVMGTRTVPVYQQMDNSGAVPYLVAAIKELSAQVTTLQTQVTALQSKG